MSPPKKKLPPCDCEVVATSAAKPEQCMTCGGGFS